MATTPPPQRDRKLSGNGLRCLAALVAREQRLEPGATVTVDAEALAGADLVLKVNAPQSRDGHPHVRRTGPPPAADSQVTLKGLFGHLDLKLDQTTLVIADVGESLFAAADLRVHRGFEFLSPAYYTSMGFAVPASIGASFADPTLRPIVLVGDGAFQMTGSELSTAVRYRQAPIVIVLNNRGYSTEREILEGPFNDIHDWRYERICDLIGGGIGFAGDVAGRGRAG